MSSNHSNYTQKNKAATHVCALNCSNANEKKNVSDSRESILSQNHSDGSCQNIREITITQLSQN